MTARDVWILPAAAVVVGAVVGVGVTLYAADSLLRAARWMCGRHE